MLPSWISNPFRSYLGGPIYHTADARCNSAVSWYRTLMNLGYQKSDLLVRLVRFIRFGVLNDQEAYSVLTGRLSKRLANRYSMMIYWIDDGWLPESAFYFKKIDWSWLVEDPPVNTGLFP